MKSSATALLASHLSYAMLLSLSWQNKARTLEEEEESLSANSDRNKSRLSPVDKVIDRKPEMGVRLG